MKNNNKYFDVNIIDTTNSWAGSHTNIIPGNDMSAKEINDYMKTINSYNGIPKDSCLYHISFNFQQSSQRKIVFSTQPDEKKFDKCHDGEFSIHLRRRNGCKCSSHDCFANIKNGKCCDKFTREIICEKLFKDKYQKQK